MKLVTSKQAVKDAKAFFDGTGITVDITEVDNGIRMLQMSKGDKIIVFKVATTYSENLGVLVTPPKEYETKYFVRGKAFGLDIDRAFTLESEASALKRKFEQRADNNGESDEVSLTLTKEEVEVLND